MINKVHKLLIATAILAGISGCVSSQTDSSHSKGYETYIAQGEQFKHDHFTSTQGETIELKADRKLVILFATWCSDSQRALKEIKASALVTDPTLQIIAIGRNEDGETLDKFNDEYQLPFPLVADPEREIYSQYANAGIPRLILLDENNKVVKTLIGEEPTIVDKLVWNK
ncbi:MULTISPECIES: TlpA family protein disulfide reductase [Pseudoalteromonas]|uniref:Redoxin domain protein n=1 Tax=Pseudoalteromonas amylolytica TaxID=1859457 RepID=A0A1S1MUL7_9GAMM|nr:MULTISPECIES: TlpA disulfide reductase family protein [Pseudoalteromonas]OHU84613.1 redoxin domain protein [Pseudoalteromonas sp. JW3]OHU92478.1 redoxin domain protein [Pseudoalteromonas amylolytica]